MTAPHSATEEELSDDFRKWIGRAKDFAHEEENWCYHSQGHNPEHRVEYEMGMVPTEPCSFCSADVPICFVCTHCGAQSTELDDGTIGLVKSEPVIDITTGKPKVIKRWRDFCVYSERAASWETKVRFTYSMDILPDGRRFRHLSVQISVPGEVHQGQLNMLLGDDKFMSLFSPAASMTFPLHPHVLTQGEASTPIPVVQPHSGEGRNPNNVHFRTAVTIHFLVDDESMEQYKGNSPTRKKVQLYGPRGELL